jgi:O-antigen/teichoic acid export membrane protein
VFREGGASLYAERVLDTDGLSESVPPKSQSRAVWLATRFGVHDAGRVLQDFAVYFPARVLSAFAAAIALPILARRLPPTELGTLALAQTLINLGWIVSMQWLTATIVRELPRHRERGDRASFRRGVIRAFGLVLLSFLAFAVMVWIASLLSSAISQHVGIIIAAAAGLSAQNLTVTLLLADLRPKLYALVETIGRVGGIALGIRLVFQGHGVEGYLIGLAVVPAAVGVFGFAFAWPRGRDTVQQSEPVKLREWVGYGVPAAFSSSIMWAFLFVDRYMLAILKTTGDVGIYSLGAVVGSQAVLIPSLALSSVGRPRLYFAYESLGRAAVEDRVRAYTRLQLIIVVPVVAFVAVAAHPMIRFLSTGFYGRYYTPAIEVAPLLALATALQALGYLGNIGLNISRRTRLQLVGTGSALTLTVIANLILIPLLGIRGCAIATVLGSLVLMLAPRRKAAQYVTWHFPWVTLGRTLIAAVLGSAAAYGARLSVNGNLLQIVVAAGAGGIVYAVTLLVLREELRPQSQAVGARSPVESARLP